VDVDRKVADLLPLENGLLKMDVPFTNIKPLEENGHDHRHSQTERAD
jgi:hypothetical protein